MHSRYPTEAWGFLIDKDQKKLAKAGFATPRGGAKNAYQNHVVRSNRVIVPYERLRSVNLSLYVDGYVVRLYPEQYFSAPNTPKPEFAAQNSPVRVGDNAFVLYRTHESLRNFSPMRGWKTRGLELGGVPVQERERGARDTGHYVVRLSNPKRAEGPPQGIFATEYADEETNYLCKAVLAWLTIHTSGSPYTTTQAAHLQSILEQARLLAADQYEFRGVIRRGLTSCPLCLRFIRYEELHATVSFEEAAGLENAAEQVEGATRSTVVNLFHLKPLKYSSLVHTPGNVAWGHAICNTRLGQRSCLSLHELIAINLKVGIVRESGIETIGWISDDYEMIRSPAGSVWIRLNGDIEEGPPQPMERRDPLDRAEPAEDVPT